MNGAIIGVFLVIIAYLVMMLAIGFFYSKGNNDSSDFYLGGRKLGPFVTAMSAEASDMSSWLLMAGWSVPFPAAIGWWRKTTILSGRGRSITGSARCTGWSSTGPVGHRRQRSWSWTITPGCSMTRP